MTDISYTYPFIQGEMEVIAQQNYYCENNIKVMEYSNAYGLPFQRLIIEDHILVDGGGLQANGKMVYNSAISDGWVRGYEFNPLDALEESKTVIFIGLISDCWGHTITDSMSKLWWLQTDEYREKYSDCPVYYWSEKPLRGNFLELLRLAGVPMNHLHYMDHLTHFNKVIVPDNCYKRLDNENTPRVYTKEYVQLIDAIIGKCIDAKKYDKVCMIRPSDSRQYTSKTIYSILKDHGYMFIDSSRCSVAEQVSIFHNAKEIVVEESSASHNAIFCRNEAKVVILRKCSYVNEFQASINQMRNLDVTYIDCHLSVLTRTVLPTEGPFFLYANEAFCSYFGVDYPGFPYKEFTKWLNYHNYFTEDIEVRSKRLQWDSQYAEIFAKELQRTREQTEKRFTWIKRLPLIPKTIKDRGFTWMVKRVMRRLMS